MLPFRPSSVVRHVICAAALMIAGAGVSRAQTTIVAGTVAPGPPQWPQYVSMENGCFKEAAIDLQLVSAGGGGAQQLATGALNIAHSGFPDFIRAANQGAAIRIVVNDVIVPPYSVHASPAIKSIADLRGKKIIIGGVKDVTLIYMKAFIAGAGLTASDVDFVYAKAALDRFTALAAGGVDAAILNPPASLRANAMGFSNLGEINDYLKDFPFTVWAANTDWAAKNRDTLTKFAACYKQGVRWLENGANKARAVEILIKYAKTDPQDAQDAYDYLITKLHSFSVDGDLSAATFAKMGAGLIDIGDLQPPVPPESNFFDGSFVRAAK